MGGILVPVADGIDTVLRDELLGQIDGIIRRGDDVELALDMVDDRLLVGTLGIEAEICRQCRSIWKKMQKRRLGRSFLTR
jgi:adenine-specific DNA-methyltransferase